MLGHMAEGVDHIYLALGYTDFRKQIKGLSGLVALAKNRMDPYSPTCLFLFCNRKRTSIKALRWDGNGFVLATKQLIGNMKFQWPKTPGELRDKDYREFQWLLDGRKIDQLQAHR